MNPVKGQATTVNEVGEQKLTVKDSVKGQITLCQDSLMNSEKGWKWHPENGDYPLKESREGQAATENYGWRTETCR
jgi:hypothetical protein